MRYKRYKKSYHAKRLSGRTRTQLDLATYPGREKVAQKSCSKVLIITLPQPMSMSRKFLSQENS